MAIEVKVPAAGESITSANVATWHQDDGAMVRQGDTLVTLETDKVSNELEAEADGRLEILVSEGEEVEIGTIIAKIDDSAEDSESKTEDDDDAKDDAEDETKTRTTTTKRRTRAKNLNRRNPTNPTNRTNPA